MQVNVETTKGLERKLYIELPAKEIDEKAAERLNNLAKTAKIDGFRPGKVPMSVVEKRFGEAARHEILNDVLSEALYKAIEQEKLNPAGRPEVAIKVFEKGKPLQFEAIFEIYPELDLVDLTGVDVEQVRVKMNESDVDEVLNNMRKQHAKWNPVGRSAKEGDQVMIDFEGFIDGKAFAGGKAENSPLTLGSKTMIPGFEDGIVGAKKGDEINVNVQFPKDYHNADYAGKEAVFKIKVHEVSESELPALDDAFAESFGVKEGGLEKLRDDLKKNMQKELKSAVKIKNKKAIMNAAKEKNEITVPTSAVSLEIENMKKQAMQQFGGKIDESKLPKLPDSLFEPQAKERVTLGIIMGEAIKKYDLKVEEDRVKALIEDVASMYDNPQEIIDWYYADPKRLSQYQMVALEDQTCDKFLETANKIEKELSYQELMGQM